MFFALVVSGCVPFALPPVTVSGDIGLAKGSTPPPQGAATTSGNWMETGFRVGARPLGLVDSYLGRPIDVGVGYLYERLPVGLGEGTTISPPLVQGAWLEFMSWSQRDINGSSAGRGGPILDIEVLASSLPGRGVVTGFGARLGFGFEGAGFVKGDGCADRGCAAYQGEGGIGIALFAEYRQIGDVHYGGLLIEFSLRLPAAAGVLFVPEMLYLLAK